MKKYTIFTLLFSVFNCLGIASDKQTLNDQLIDNIFAKNIEEVTNALEKGADVSVVTPKRKTPLLHLAAGFNRVDIVELLLKYGADKDVVDSYGERALDTAALFDNTEMIKLLLPSDARKDVAYLSSALCVACGLNHANNVTLLLQAGANPMLRAKGNKNAFEHAGKAHPKALKALVDYCQENNAAARATLIKYLSQGSMAVMPSDIMQSIARLVFPGCGPLAT
jgi:ankyrin repeat protein